MSSMEQQVSRMVAEQLFIDESLVTPQATFAEDLGADSLDQVELVMSLEQAFGIQITDAEGDKIITVQDVFDLIKGRVKHAA